ncbi:hypothetical protein [Vibrio neptunius]|uniref:DUF4157 domain-containing protein n=1 Tax=Vibrio neptunius TaxID=170651 RepID=A0ABS3A006_9VIBR|nr:hypothetical protein [Vibrio neptunius]MBN3492749.1 hypothetical protein [Vibrio neptunius]MBN3515246.1 hypothetical protein [Vibrio neptunius]MBN3548878.1 hypothetical protein [Vibrio neptunius]MBN3577340.1 hypothetical protein [Vibrio neptunius]MCH9871004.1 hypothetical protein [Vibrio neptunius]
MSSFKDILLFGTLFVSSGVFANSSLTYQLSIDPDDADKVIVNVDTSGLEQVKVSPARTLTHSDQPVISCQTASGIITVLDGLHSQKCQQIEWFLKMKHTPDHGMDISQQIDSRSVDKGWYFISEWDSLPRVEGSRNIRVCTPEQNCQEMPELSEPPMFVVWGMKSTELNINDNKVTVFSDAPQVMKQVEQWKPVLETSLRYLNSVFSNTQRRDWQMAFFKKDRSSGSLSGAAGQNMILINAWLEQGKLTPVSLKMLLKIAAHESVHVLDSASRPTWAAESLAEYYAIKSLQTTPYAADNPIHFWHGFAQKFPFSSTGLIEANRLFSEQGAGQYYPLFYFKGSAFWYELDAALSHTGSSLDSLMSRLNFETDGSLSIKFVSAVTEKIGDKEWTAISLRYL